MTDGPVGRRSVRGGALDERMTPISEAPFWAGDGETVYATDREPQGEERTEAVDVGSELYQGVLEAADYQTGGPRTLFPAGVTRETLANAVRQGTTHSPEAVRSAIETAVANDDLLAWEDRSGATRYTPTDEASLRELVGAQNALDEPRQALIERAAALIGGGADE